MTRGDGWVERRGTSLRVRWRDGDVTRSRTVASEDEAERLLLTVRQQKRSGRYVAPVHMTVKEMIEGYLDRGVHRWSSNTVWTYRDRALRDIYPMLGAQPVQRVTPAMVQHWVDTLTTSYGRAPNSVEGAVRVFSGAWREAMRLRIVAENVVTGVAMPRVRQQAFEAWSRADVAKVLAVVVEDPRWHAFYRLAMATGLRPGELRALVWSDIDLDAGILMVNRTMTRTIDGKRTPGRGTKTSTVRAIAIASSVVAALQDYRRSQLARRLAHQEWVNTNVVFDRGNGEHMGQTTIDRHHRIVERDAGVHHIKPHGLRHTYATLALANGVSLKVVSDTLGHRSVAITADVYVHTSLETQRDAADIMDRLMG